MTAQWETDLPQIVRVGRGLEVVVGDLGTVHKVRSEITDGRMVVIEHSLPPCRLAAPLHRHSREDEISYVLAGQMGALLGDHVVWARAGSYVVKPRGQWHTYWNAGASDLRLMELLVPGGFEGCLERLAEAISTRDSDVGTVERIGAEHGVQFDFASVPDICKHFGVTLAGWPGQSAEAARP
jgi:mannose-6-phosphate isomerase-like protein (cupin superfamily)